MLTINDYLEIGIEDNVLEVNSGNGYTEVKLTEQERYTTIGNLAVLLAREISKEINIDNSVDGTLDNIKIEAYQRMLSAISVEYLLKGATSNED